ncbi:MAG: peptidylprolyl isomerase [Candidatus Acidiferrales bacterium]
MTIMTNMRNVCGLIGALALPLIAAAQGTTQQGSGRVVEEVIARVNNEIVTLSDLARARESIMSEIEQECRQTACTAEKRTQLVTDAETHLVRDLIDQSLIVQRAKDLGIGVETDLIKYMDRIRQENNLKSMEELEDAVVKSGLVFEDWKDSIRKQMLQQELIRREVRPDITEAQVKEYYEAHKEEFVRDQRYFLSEIFCSIEGKPETEVPATEEKCRNLRKRVVEGGEDFAKMARSFSDGSTSAQGGDLGGEGFAPKDLAPELLEAVAKLKRGDVTDVIRVQTGFLILRLNHRYEKGLQPLENVTGEIQNRIYMQHLPPELRKYLTELRTQSYVLLKPGYVDSAAVEASPITEIAALPPVENDKEEKKRKKFLWIF